MRRVAPVCALLLVAGCASGGSVAPIETASPKLEPAEVECAGCAVVAEAEPPAPVEPDPPPPPDMEAACLEAAGLSEAGEHKPAVEALERAIEAGAACDDPVLEAVEDSRRRLNKADDLVRDGLEARRAGDIATARESFRLALAVYPKYYWARRLEQDLPTEPAQGAEELRAAASEARSAGRFERALELLEQAGQLPSAGPATAEEIKLVRAELAASRLAEARRAQQQGDLDRAVARARDAIAARPEPPVQARVVDFARRLGLNLFAAGELVRARDLWGAALSLDGANPLLLEYVDEVESRLRNLNAIKHDGG